MYAHRFFPVAALLATVACSDQAPTGLAAETPTPGPSASNRQTIVGYVVAQGDGSAAAFLRTASTVIPLHGEQATIVARVDGAEVSILGTADAADDGFIVESFTVLTVRQRPVIDGVLVETNGGLSLRLANGAMLPVTDAPATLQALAGARIWMAPASLTGDFDFGVIEDAR